jgi:2-keto-3-deoxy-L-rhamnonate aldolase RhmA
MFKQLLATGRRPLVGTILSTGSPEVADLMARIGYQFLWIDCEHGMIELATAGLLAQVIGERASVLVRVPTAGAHHLQRAADLGAHGIIVPQVGHADQARAVVAACHYPPRGRRGVGVARAQGYGLELASYVHDRSSALAVLVQIESAAAVAQIDDILAVPGVDGVFVGPHDLSASLGHLGELEHPVVVEALERVRSACVRRGTPIGTFAADAQGARRAVEQGYDLVAVGIDLLTLGRAAQRELELLSGR